MPEATEWIVASRVLNLKEPIVMGILNLTPDSFYDGGRVLGDIERAIELCGRMLEEGATIIDLGGESTRPGSLPVSSTEEKFRVFPILEKAITYFPDSLFSIDTYKSEVASGAIALGVHIINDISAGRIDEALLPVVADSSCGYVLMHMQGTPQTMQENPYYENPLEEIASFFEERLEYLDSLGIEPGRVVLDPGIGFGKRVEDNLALISNAGSFARFGRPLLYGVSRKSFLGAITGRVVEDRLPATIATQVLLLLQGVKILRVHDVSAARDAIKIYLAFEEYRKELRAVAEC